MAPFLEIERAPALCTVLCSTREQALAAPCGPIRWGFCDRCGLIYNLAFDETLLEYSGTYENSLHFSPHFREYALDSARRLVEQYCLRGKHIVEIGSGQGDFLSLLCRLGDNTGTGFDPAFDPGKQATALDPRVTIVPEYYSEAHALGRVDLICSRHVFEHIPRPLEFLRSIRRAIGERERTLVFFEVPNATYVLENAAAWDVIYEHCSYFTAQSLRQVFREAGFQPLETRTTFGDQYLTIVAEPAPLPRDEAVTSQQQPVEPPQQRTRQLVREFAERFGRRIQAWRERLTDVGRRGRRVVLWGGGSKAVAFLNDVGVSDGLVPYVVDLNLRKHGHFIVGTGQRIVAPAFLREYRPEIVIIMNGIYRQEIEQMCRDMGLEIEIVLAADPIEH